MPRPCLTAESIWLCLVAVCLSLAGGVTPSRAADPSAVPESAAPGFVRDVLPALTKLGCNSGACHGAFSGRGGFRLSLWGFDPHSDHRSLVTEDRGRRVFPSAPQQSLLLLKPSLALPHGGGRRIERDSEAFALLSRWLETGLVPPTGKDPVVTRLEVSPIEMVLEAGAEQDLVVRAHWSDGVAQDVTRWALYESRTDSVAGVAGTGRIKAGTPGRAVVTVFYYGQVAAVPVTVPFAKNVDLPPQSGSHFIDTAIVAEWRKLGLAPADRADDAEFVRRVHLDVIGTLPTAEEVRGFLASGEADKRAKLIERLLERPEYADYWSLKWSDLLRAHRRALGEKGLASFSGWIKQAFRENRPLDRIVRELLTAQGNLYTNGPVAFYFADKTPSDLAETTAQIFLGIRLQCARCHHHPFEVWSQDDYYGLAACFARVERKDTREAGRFGGAQSVRLAAGGTVQHPNTGQVVPPRFMGQAIPPDGPADERQALADWITRADNAYFARNVVNRYCGYLLGRGLVEPIDDLRATNPASHPALLDALAQDFIAHKYDLKHLIRTICTSQAYQLASDVSPQRDVDGAFFTHRKPRRLPAEVLLDAINQVVGSRETFEGMPAGVRAISLADSAVPSTFLDTFGRPLRLSTCECERPNRADLRQVLYLANSEALHAKLAAADGRVAKLLAAGRDQDQIIEELYLSALSRLPLAEERTSVKQLLSASPSPKEGLEDLLWTLVNCAEFSYQH